MIKEVLFVVVYQAALTGEIRRSPPMAYDLAQSWYNHAREEEKNGNEEFKYMPVIRVEPAVSEHHDP
jgi:hypothetical protein